MQENGLRDGMGDALERPTEVQHGIKTKRGGTHNKAPWAGGEAHKKASWAHWRGTDKASKACRKAHSRASRA